ncbi:MAG: PEP-CTERM sorting domain-containing protein [Candidatus Acidiferrales bacterium]
MKYSKAVLAAAIVVMIVGIMVPPASADSQKAVMGSQVMTVNASSVQGSKLDLTLPLSLFDVVLSRDEIKGAKIPTLTLEFFKTGSTTPYEIETFSGVFVTNASMVNGPRGREFSADFRFNSRDIVYSTSVPEPSSLALLAAGLTGLIALSAKKFSFSRQSAQ